MRIAFTRWRSGGLLNRPSPRKRLLPKKKTSSGFEFVSGLADGASAMPAKWSRPVFSFRFCEGKISRALIVSGDFRDLGNILRTAFLDFHADIHWQLADGDRVTTYKTYHGTHRGEFLGAAPTARKIQFETVDVMRVRNGKITEHWGVANLFSLMQQLGIWPAKQDHS